MISEGEESFNGNPDNAADVEYFRFYFSPTVDDFTKLEISDSWIIPRPAEGPCTACGDPENAVACADCTDNLLRTFTNPSIHIQSQKKLSYIREYRGTNGNGEAVTFPYMTVVIDVTMGEIQSITWDKGCTFCTPSQCVDNEREFDGTMRGSKEGDKGEPSKACMVEDPDCFNGGDVAAHCPLQVYVVWTGTDADGLYLTSSEMRFSSYKDYSLASFTDVLESKYETVKDATDYASSDE